MKILNWLFKNKKLQKDIRKEEALKIYEEIEDLIDIYLDELIKIGIYSKASGERVKSLYIH